MTKKQGSLTCVGLGITMGAHLTPIAQSHIEQADVVFSLGNSGLMKDWLSSMNNRIIDLQQCYQPGKPRDLSYQQMQQQLIEQVRLGKRVVAAFYGHPGVFVTPGHKAIAQANAEGYQAKMLAGISAEDCLIADCGIDPGRTGCASFEASQFMLYKRHVDPSAYLILWQVGLAGDSRLTEHVTSSQYRDVLIDVLSEHYPLDQEIILYEAPSIASQTTRVERMPLQQLRDADVNQCTTMIVMPSYHQLVENKAVRDRLQKIGQRRQQPKLHLV